MSKRRLVSFVQFSLLFTVRYSILSPIFFVSSICYVGYGGKNCEKPTCKNENCSNNGVCVEGKCVCFNNFGGPDCSQQIQTINQLCSNHGEFDYYSKVCTCHRGWSGVDCARNDNCLDKSCSACKHGWTGLFCLDKAAPTCDQRCSLHGICINGTCNCSPGFQGRNCDISKRSVINKSQLLKVSSC